MNRTVGIVLTIITVLCCACPGLAFCFAGAAVAAGVPVTTTLGGVSSSQSYPPMYGIALICLSVILILIPIAVGFFTLRNKPAPVQSPMIPPDQQVPPAS
jgi:hypothetical protein